jgi:hypothetical protein
MVLDIDRETAALLRLTVKRLRERYAEAFGESTTASNKPRQVRRIAWRLRERARGSTPRRPSPGVLGRIRSLSVVEEVPSSLTPKRHRLSQMVCSREDLSAPSSAAGEWDKTPFAHLSEPGH